MRKYHILYKRANYKKHISLNQFDKYHPGKARPTSGAVCAYARVATVSRLDIAKYSNNSGKTS